MPRSKRRATDNMSSTDDDRYSSKRLRNSGYSDTEFWYTCTITYSKITGLFVKKFAKISFQVRLGHIHTGAIKHLRINPKRYFYRETDLTRNNLGITPVYLKIDLRQFASLLIKSPGYYYQNQCISLEKAIIKYFMDEEDGRRSTRAEDTAFSQKRCLTWFREYTSPDDPETLGPDGMEKFCEHIGVDPENVVMLVLAFKMQARQLGFFTKEEWLKGLAELQCDTIQKLQYRLEHLRCLLNDQNTFKAIYRYAYDFARDKDQRSMEIDTAKAMLQLLLGKHWPLYTQFSQFLEQSKYKVINKDQWCNILEFSRTICNDLSNYDVDGAWPVMLDEFVEWLKSTRTKSDIS